MVSQLHRIWLPTYRVETRAKTTTATAKLKKIFRIDLMRSLSTEIIRQQNQVKRNNWSKIELNVSWAENAWHLQIISIVEHGKYVSHLLRSASVATMKKRNDWSEKKTASVVQLSVHHELTNPNTQFLPQK